MTDDPSPAPAEPTDAKQPVEPTVSDDAVASPESVITPPPSVDPVAPPPAPRAKISYSWGTGRRKSAVARVRIADGHGKFLINKRKVDEYFRIQKDRNAVMAPLQAVDGTQRVDVFVNVFGGGITGQAGAIVLGLARALCHLNTDHVPPMRDGDFLTRDSRKVERKKPGQRGARRRFQFSKR